MTPDNVAKSNFQVADSMHGYCANGAVTGIIITNIIGNFSDKVSGNSIQLGMIGYASTGHSNPVADAKLCFKASPNSDHFTCCGIAKWQKAHQVVP